MFTMNNPKTYGFLMAAVAAVFAVFHILVMLKVFPNNIIWGGRIKNENQIAVMELISIILIILAGTSGLLRGIKLSGGESSRIFAALMWVFAGVFLLNTVGNIFAESKIEKIAFTPVTLVMAYTSVRLALGF